MSVDVKNSPSMQQVLRLQDQIASGWIKNMGVEGNKRCFSQAMAEFIHDETLYSILRMDVLRPYIDVYPTVPNPSVVFFNDHISTTHDDVLNLVDVMVDYTEQLVEEGILD